MSWTKTAKESIKKAGLHDKDSDYDGMIGKALDELVDVFSKQGHSGMSAQWVSSLFRKLVKYGGFFSKKDEDKAMKEFMLKNYPDFANCGAKVYQPTIRKSVVLEEI